MRFILDNKIDFKIYSMLEMLGAEQIIKTVDIPQITGSTSGHPDLQIHFICNSTAVCAPQVYDYYKNKLPSEITLIEGKTSPAGTYPKDIAYNVARIGKNIICNIKNTEPEILNRYQSLNYIIIDVKQGYSKCNLCIVDENSVITEDSGLFSILSSAGIDVCKITPGYVKLDGYPYGFVGGASGYINNKILFCGSLNHHPDRKRIYSFVKSHNAEILELSDEALQDYGSIIEFS